MAYPIVNMFSGLILSHSVISRSALAVTAPPWWYITRMSAVSAYVVLTISVLLGLLQSIALQTRQRLAWTVDELHQWCATLTGALVLLHLYTLYRDTFIGFSIFNLVFPGDQPYKVVPTNLGILALYGLLTLLITSWFRRRMSHAAWRAIHYVSFVTFLFVTLHGVFGGSDNDEPWMRAIYGFAAGSVLFLTAMRLFMRAPAESQRA